MAGVTARRSSAGPQRLRSSVTAPDQGHLSERNEKQREETKRNEKRRNERITTDAAFHPPWPEPPGAVCPRRGGRRHRQEEESSATRQCAGARRHAASGSLPRIARRQDACRLQ